MALTPGEREAQAQFDILYKTYQAALSATPRDEAGCLEIAEQLLELARGTALEQRQQQVVERHKRKLNR
jgi:hypothetical protein